MRRVATIGMALATTFVPCLACAASDIAALPNPVGATEAHATGASHDGTVVVGWTRATPTSDAVAIRWVSGQMQLLGTDGVYTSFKPLGVSGDGKVVAGLRSAYMKPALGFTWTETTGVMNSGTLWSGYAIPNALCFDGTVIAGSGTEPCGIRALLRTNGSWESLGTIVPCCGCFDIFSGARAISSDGTVVVGSSDTPTGRMIFRWTRTGGMVGLGLGPAGTGSEGYGVSADGRFVVGYSTTPNGDRPVMYNDEGTLFALPIPPGAAAGQARAVDNLGNAVGFVKFGSTSQAWMWRSNGVNGKLRDIILTDFGVNTLGWTLELASAVSPDGAAIVGDGVDPQGVKRAFVVSLGEPLAEPHCAADFDFSGFVDVDDFNLFVPRFVDGDRRADVDGSDFVDVDDFNFFVEHFVAGC